MTFLLILFAIQTLAIFLNLLKFISRKRMVDVLRFSYGFFLIFSGFVKILDPLGFSYKLQEYFEVFGLEWMIPLTLILSIAICAFEILIAFFLIYGIQVKKALYANLVLMISFTFLTFYSAYFNAVTDCGCFGDFMKLDPWFSFQKDIVLLVVSIVLFINKSIIKQIFSTRLTYQLLLTSCLVVLFVPFYALANLPFIDFRAYSVGSSIIDGRQLPDNAKKDVYEDVWYYEVDGEVKEFYTADKPWEIHGAIFKDRVSKLISKGDEPLIHDFDILDEISDVDMTDSILNLNRVILVVCYDIEKTNIKGHQKIKKIISNSIDYGTPVYGLSSSSKYDVNNKLSSIDIEYPYFLVDQTTLKTIVRSNPGVIVLENGVIVDKFHWRNVSDQFIHTQD